MMSSTDNWFSPASRDDWITVVEKLLRGASADSLRRTDEDGLVIDALYDSGTARLTGDIASSVRRLPHDPVQRVAYGWDVRQPLHVGDNIKAANWTLLDDVGQGATSLWLHVDTADNIDFGESPARFFARLFDNVILSAVGVHFDGGANTHHLVARFIEYLDNDLTKANLYAALDPFVAAGHAKPDIIMAAGFALADHSSEQLPASIFSVNGWHWHNKGVSAASELAIILASVTDIMRRAMAAGLAPSRIAPLIEVTIALPADSFAGLVKCRALRHGWAGIMAGLGLDPDKHRLHLHAVPSLRMFSLLDQEVNMVRTTTALLGGALGNADALSSFAHDILTGESPRGRRLARMTHLLMIEESEIAQAIDPAGGAGFIEARSDDLAMTAWSSFQAIEKQGGASTCYKDGMFAALAKEGRRASTQASLTGKASILGVTIQPDTASVADQVIDGWFAEKNAIARPAQIVEEYRRKAAEIQPRIICLLPTGGLNKATEALKKQSDQLCMIGGLLSVTLIFGDDSAREMRTARPDVIIYIDTTLDDIADLCAVLAKDMPDITFVAAADITGGAPLIDALEMLLGVRRNA